MSERIQVQHESKVPVMRRIGIIGGFGQWATQDIVNRILKASVVRVPQYGNRGYPPMDIRIVNQAPMKLNPDGSFPDELEPDPSLLEAARFVGTHSDFLILPSNTPHLFKRQIEEASGKPLLSIIDVTVNEVKKRKYKRVGIIAIGLTLKKRLFQDPLDLIGVESVTLPEDMSQAMDEEGIWELQEGAEANDVNASTKAAVAYLREKAVDGIILGCTEIPILLGDEAEATDIINPSQLLAEAAVDRALEKE